MEEWKNEVRRQASAHHMCEENRTALSAVETKSEAVELYKKTIDWALEQGYPSLDTLRRHFSDCEQYGVYIDKEFHGETLMDHQVYVFHNCKGVVRTGLNRDKRIIPMMYFANGCAMTVVGVADAPAIVPLYIFGKNDISSEKSDFFEARVYVC